MIETQEIKRALNHYVNTVLCADNLPDPNDRAYHPADRDLKNHIYKAKRALELSKLDQHNLKLKLQEWESSHPDSTFYFRLHVTKDKQPPTENDKHFTLQHRGADFTSAPETVVMHNNLNKHFSRFIKPSGKRKWYIAKYRNTMTLLDATYKTTMYDLALFFVTVQTNAGYTVAAEFLVHSETNEQIEEALNILKQWNPLWSPVYFMCDYSEAEILAIETAFPCASVYLCDFHREQCWERWVKNHKHGLTDIEASELLDLLRDCAWAPPCGDNGKQQEYHYQQAVERLKASPVWKTHEQVQIWLTTGWLSIPKVTILCDIYSTLTIM